MNKFAFIIHPLEMDDVARKFSWANKVPESLLEYFVKMIPPVKASNITGIESHIGTEIEGFFVGVPLTSKQMITLPISRVYKKIIKACKKAEEMGAQIIGLGAFTSVIGDKGISIAKEISTPITTGNSYTVATAIEGTRLAAEKMGYNLKNCTLTIIGGTGSIGRAVSLILCKDVKKLILVARKEEKLQALKEEIQKISPELDIAYTLDVNEAVKNSQLIISASGAVRSLIDPLSLQPGAVVCDVARPRDVAVKVAREREDVLVIEGGIVEVPGSVNFNFNFGYPPGTAYACMAETMMLTLEGMFDDDYSLGPIIDLKKVEETLRMAEKHGFKLAGLRSFERALSDEKIEEIRRKAEEKPAVFC